jgi:hypothetical protein
MSKKIRALFIAALTIVLFGAIIGGAAAKPSGSGPGNSPNAKACQKNGWMSLYTSTGAMFTSESQCVSYAAQGGKLNTSPPPVTRTLTVSKTGSGAGTVTGTGIDCGDDCTEGYADGTPVPLTATEAPGSTFTGWSGDCTGTTCTLSMTANKTAVANFDTTPTTSIGLTAPQGLELFCSDDLAYNFLLVSGSGVLTSDDLPLGSGPVLHINDVSVPLEIHSATGDFTDRPVTAVAGSGDTVYVTGTSRSDGSTVTSNTITCP